MVLDSVLNPFGSENSSIFSKNVSDMGVCLKYGSFCFRHKSAHASGVALIRVVCGSGRGGRCSLKHGHVRSSKSGFVTFDSLSLNIIGCNWKNFRCSQPSFKTGAETSRQNGSSTTKSNRTPSDQRVAKDPSSYANIEELRRELEDAKGQQAFTITNTINWLSRAANQGGASLAFKAYRFAVGGWEGGLLGSTRSSDPDKLREIEDKTSPELLKLLQATLLVPKVAVLKLLLRCPTASEVPIQELTRRLIDLKTILPGSDVSRIVEYIPSAFLSKDVDWEMTSSHIRDSSTILRQGLVGADTDAMFEEDPSILFEDLESLRVGLRRMDELWPGLSPSTLEQSDPQELALAVRALGLSGPPKSV